MFLSTLFIPFLTWFMTFELEQKCLCISDDIISKIYH